LEEYVGGERRFEYIGTYKDNILVYDDYAHHPTEIKSTVESAKQIKCHKNWVVFQSHTYSRTVEHLEEFADVLKEFDNIIVAPIYPAREKNIWNVKEDDLVKLIKDKNNNVRYIDSFDKIVEYLKDNLESDDLVITVGAGPVNEVGLKLLGKK
jgi:UDP-N-acetylmuramate--alanine ligase